MMVILNWVRIFFNGLFLLNNNNSKKFIIVGGKINGVIKMVLIKDFFGWRLFNIL